ncbi:hypothetical protein Tco_0542044 [Tanacetum coccineum]
MHIDHMSQPWRTFASIINICIFGKVTTFDQLRLLRAQILWGMFYKKNVDFVELIWEDFMYHIDNRKSTVARRSNMPYLRFTKEIIQHFISKDKNISLRNNMFMHGVKNDSVLGFIKFISMYEIRQVYVKLILDVLVSKEMMESKAYKSYLDFATGKVIPKEARKRTKAHMKETSLTADDNIISEDPDTALELAKSISRTKAEEQEAARLVHETHARLVIEQPTRRRRQTEDTRKAIKASKCDLKSQHQTGGSYEGAGSKLKVLDESKGKTKDTNKGVSSKPEVPDVSKAMSSDQESENNIDLNNTDDEEEAQEDEFVHTPDDYVPIDDETQDVDDEEYVSINEELYGDVNVEMKDAEHDDKDKGDEEMTDAEKVETEHKEINQEVASAQVQDEVPTTTIVAPVTQKKRLRLLHQVPVVLFHPTMSSSMLTVPVSVIVEPTVLSSIPEVATEAPATTIPPFTPPIISRSQQSTPLPIPTTSTITTEAPTSTSVYLEYETLFALQLSVYDLKKEVKELKQVDLTTTLRTSITSKVPPAINEYLGSSVGDALQNEL